MAIITFEGGMGSGKTLSAVKMAKKYHDQNYKVYSNIKLAFEYTPLTLPDLLNYANNEAEFKDCFFLIDEFAIFVGDSRRSGSNRNIAISYFIVMGRKLNINIALTTQTFGMIEKRVRENTSVLVECSTIGFGDPDDDEFILLVINKMTSDKGKVKTLKFIGNDYFDLYNTYEIVNYSM